jgi:hypothetical protein
MTQSAKQLRLPRSEQSTDTAATKRGSKSVANSGEALKASVPSIIHELYSAPTLYPDEDPALFERLFEELAHALAPADLTQWLLVADLRAVILDEGRYRKMLAMIMSPKKLIEPEESEQETESKLNDRAVTLYTLRGVCNVEKLEEQKRIWEEINKEVQDQYEARRALEKDNAPELERRAAVSNFQEYSEEIEKLDCLIERCRKTRTTILSRLEAMKAISSNLHRTAEIEDVEFTEAAQ